MFAIFVVMITLLLANENNRVHGSICNCGYGAFYSDGLYCDCSYRNLTSIPQTLPRTVRSLNLKGNNINEIKPSELSLYESSLRSLDMTENPIANISENVFSHLTNLVELNVTTRKIHYSAFRGLSNLRRLYVNGDRRLSSLPISLLKPLVKLQHVTINDANITKIDKNFLSGFKELKVVDFSFNQLKTVEENTFFVTNELRKIYLGSNQINNIHGDTFSSLKLLETLDIHNNNLTAFSPDIFKQSSKLRVLEMQQNNFESLPSNIFENCIDMNHLDLSQNPWKDFPIKEIKHLKYLWTLNLQNISKNLNSVSLDQNNFHVGRLDLSMNCGLKIVDLPKIKKYLNMSNSCLKNLPNLGSTDYIDLYRNELESVELGFVYKTVNMSFNNIRNVSILGGGIYDSVSLDLSHNKIKDTSDLQIRSLVFIQHLNLSYNQLSSVNHFYSYSYDRMQAQTLDFSNNNIRSLEENALKNFHQLSEINLKGNKISQLYNIKFPNDIRKLNLADNSLSIFPDQVNNLKYLMWLDLSNNNIKVIPKNGLQSLDLFQNLYLQNNTINGLPIGFLKGTPLSNILDLSGNMLACSCNLTIIFHTVNASLKGNCVKDNTTTPLLSFQKPLVQQADTGCNLCPLTPCDYKGDCVPDNQTGFICKCYQGYIGRFCESLYIDCHKLQNCGTCNTTVCLNNGKCIETSPKDVTCQCTPNYTGNFCQIPLKTITNVHTVVTEATTVVQTTGIPINPTNQKTTKRVTQNLSPNTRNATTTKRILTNTAQVKENEKTRKGMMQNLKRITSIETTLNKLLTASILIAIFLGLLLFIILIVVGIKIYKYSSYKGYDKNSLKNEL